MAANVGKDLSILSGRTRRAAEENVGNERIRFVLKGLYGQALIALETRILIVKPGFSAGVTGGVRVTSFNYADITTIEINRGLLFGVIEIGTPSYNLSQSRDFWTWHPDKNPAQANNCLPVDRFLLQEFMPYIEELRQLVAQFKTNKPSAEPSPKESLAREIEKLAELYTRGMLSDEEFKAAKDILLKNFEKES